MCIYIYRVLHLKKKPSYVILAALIAGNFSCALSVLHQTLRRKGLGLDGSELESEESMQVAAEKYPLSEGMDLSVARQRFYVSPHALLLLRIHYTHIYTHVTSHKHIHTQTH